MTTTIDHCPNEILTLIGQELNVMDLRTFSLLSKKHYAISLPIFNEIPIKTSRYILKMLIINQCKFLKSGYILNLSNVTDYIKTPDKIWTYHPLGNALLFSSYVCKLYRRYFGQNIQNICFVNGAHVRHLDFNQCNIPDYPNICVRKSKLKEWLDIMNAPEPML